MRQADVRRHPRLPRPLDPRDDRPGRGILRRHVERIGAQVAGQHPVGGREMVAVVVMQRPDDRDLVHDLGMAGQQLRDLDAGHDRRDRP